MIKPKLSVFLFVTSFVFLVLVICLQWFYTKIDDAVIITPNSTGSSTEYVSTSTAIIPAEELDIIPEPKPCIISGCSGQICAEEEMASTCEYRPEYMCYKQATCERQKGGLCGWTETPALRSCLLEHKGAGNEAAY